MSVKMIFQVAAPDLADLVMETSQLLEVLPAPVKLTMSEDNTLALIEVAWDDAATTVDYFERRFGGRED